MPLSAETACLEEVAASLGREPEWLRRNWLRFHLRHGFPRRLPGVWAWPRRAVEAWVRAGGVARPPGNLPANENDPGADPAAAYVAAAHQTLLDRYGANR